MPEDSTVADYDAWGKPLIDLPLQAPIRKAMSEIMGSLDGLV